MTENSNKFKEIIHHYSKKDIAAVVVSYNGEDIAKTVDTVLEQVNHLIIIDNNSEERFKIQLSDYKDNDRITVIENRENVGQAEALNQGWIKAEKMGYSLTLTMDQDSQLEEHCVGELLEGIHAGFDSVGANYENKKIAENFKKVRYLITSGNLLRIDAIKNVGGYDHNLFIDSVDFDISLRLRKAGYKLAMVRDAKMRHSIGELNESTEIYEHSIVRHYYISRNHYYIIYKYWNNDPVFCIKKQISYLLNLRGLRKESDHEQKREARKRGKKDARTLLLQSSMDEIGE